MARLALSVLLLLAVVACSDDGDQGSSAAGPESSTVDREADLPPPVTAGEVPPESVCAAGADPDRPGPVDQVRPLAPEFAGMRAAFDTESGRIVMVTLGETWSFDVCTNTWTRMAPAPAGTGEATLVYDQDSDRTVAFTGLEPVEAWAYDVDADSWSGGTESDPPLTLELYPGAAQAIYDPVSGLIATPGRGGRYGTYDVDSDRWDTVTLEEGDGADDDFGIVIGYHPETDRVIEWATDVSLVDLRDGSVTVDDDEAPELIYGWPPPPILTASDPDQGLGIIHTLGGGELHAYDPALPGWTVIYGEDDFPGGPYDGIRGYDAMAYDTVNDRLVVIGGIYKTQSGWPATDDVWALDTASGAWTQLLEPSSPEN